MGKSESVSAIFDDALYFGAYRWHRMIKSSKSGTAAIAALILDLD
jgi:hypothetical protein